MGRPDLGPSRWQFPEIPEERQIAVERFLAKRPELVPYASNLLRRPDIAPLAVEMLLEFEAEERTRREPAPKAPRSAGTGRGNGWMDYVAALSGDDIRRLAVELDSEISQHRDIADQ
ncbi:MULTISPECIES: hypothetical protein [Streptomyces]|uniref:Uncharacterized protein n=1 Tax=Streptomyces chartreusis NRRL 3882 TaxID=1079985 RepID=A0A2N9BM41_STRCX|nr:MULTISPECIES: hypothetical protein [Streptomyces]MYS92281.1 hypothetical protein [Streptomyces sp. SID5464]SOR84415.1 hypothetical protein SCNRRL3882_7860 [Streptomyces chartreusis NRRL 3882]